MAAASSAFSRQWSSARQEPKAAWPRFAELELAMVIYGLVVTEDRMGGAEALGRRLGLTPEQGVTLRNVAPTDK